MGTFTVMHTAAMNTSYSSNEYIFQQKTDFFKKRCILEKMREKTVELLKKQMAGRKNMNL